MKPTSCIRSVLLATLIVGAVANEQVLARRRLLPHGYHMPAIKSSENKHKMNMPSPQIKSSRSPPKKTMSNRPSTKKKKTMSNRPSTKKKKTMSSGPSTKKKKTMQSDSKSKKSSSDSSSKSRKKPPSKSKPSPSKSKSKKKPPSKSKPRPSKSSKPNPSKSKSKSKPCSGKGGSGSGKGKGKGKGKGMQGKGGSGPGTKPLNAFDFEDEPCGQNVNGGCDSDPPIFGNINFHQTIIGEFGAVLDPGMETFERDSDWYVFDIDKPACVQATIASNYEGTVVLYEGSTCTDLVNVASGDTSGAPAIYCFPEAGQYGVFVAPLFAVQEPCERDPFKYYLALEYIECGTCLIASESPGCSDNKCRNRVCKDDSSCCDMAWTTACVDKARELCDCEEGDSKIITEDEPCGESINGGCFDDPPAYSSIEFGQTIVGEYGALLSPGDNIVDQDSDWYLFYLDKPACVRATLDSIVSGDVVLFEGSTFETDTCRDDLINVASGDSDGDPAVYCFPEAGEYGVFVAPTFVDLSPCQGRQPQYILTLENLGQCGTCVTENSSSGCVNKSCESTVCELDESCCEDIWDAVCVQKAELWCECAGGEAPDVVTEDEPCGEDINGGCTSDPPVFGSMELCQTLLGEYGAVFNATEDIYEQDSDWFLFDTQKDDTCVEAILTSREPGEVILFEGATLESGTCTRDLVNVASGGSDGVPAVYCFPDAGEYGVFVAPLFQDETPCEGKPDTYTLTLNGLECGTCFIVRDSPGCSDKKCRDTVCKYDDSCCKDAWDETCVEKAKLWCDCSKPDKPDSGSSSTRSGKGKGSSPSDDSGKGKGSPPMRMKGMMKGMMMRGMRMKGMMKGMYMKGMKGGKSSKASKSSKGSKSSKSSKSYWRDR